MKGLYVFRHSHQLLEVKHFRAADVLLQLLWRVEEFQKLLIENFEETSPESRELLLTQLFEKMLDIEVDELFPVFFRYIFIFATLNKLDGLFLSKNLVVNGERSCQDIL